MANRDSTKAIDIQEVLTGAAVLELKLLQAGIDYWQTWIGQAAKLSEIANDGLKSIQDNKATASGTARRLTDFGKENARVFANLSGRLSERYFSEIARLTTALESAKKPAGAARASKASAKKRPVRVRTRTKSK